jgi:hypothetical protein
MVQNKSKCGMFKEILKPYIILGGPGWGVLILDPPPEKILNLDPPKTFFCQKWEKLAKKWHFFNKFWPTLMIFTNLL